MSLAVSKSKRLKGSIKVKKAKPTSFFLRILSRHKTSGPLRGSILIRGKRVVYRHGSTTESAFEYEINSTESVKISADKLLMKEAFDKAEVKHAPWIHLLKASDDNKEWKEFIKKLKFGEDKDSWLIIKNRYGSRGTGNTLVKNKVELDSFLKSRSKSLNNYIVEEYKTYSVEYRLHVSEEGYFYTCRKVLRNNTPKEQRFQRHDDNCSWLVEQNPGFNKPENWNEIVEDCKKALKMIGADVLAFDVKCTSIKEVKDKKCRFILIESCSAPSFGDVTLEKYKQELPKIIERKYSI